jgi:hypothetical protein
MATLGTPPGRKCREPAQSLTCYQLCASAILIKYHISSDDWCFQMFMRAHRSVNFVIMHLTDDLTHTIVYRVCQITEVFCQYLPIILKPSAIGPLTYGAQEIELCAFLHVDVTRHLLAVVHGPATLRPHEITNGTDATRETCVSTVMHSLAVALLKAIKKKEQTLAAANVNNKATDWWRSTRH